MATAAPFLAPTLGPLPPPPNIAGGMVLGGATAGRLDCPALLFPLDAIQDVLLGRRGIWHGHIYPVGQLQA